MANKRITELTPLTNGSIAPNDLTVIVDISNKETKSTSFDDIGNFVADNYKSSQSYYADAANTAISSVNSCQANSASYANSASALTRPYYNIGVRQSDSSSYAQFANSILNPNVRVQSAITADTSSYGMFAKTASYFSGIPLTSSYAYSSSWSDNSVNSINAVSASYVSPQSSSISSSYAVTSSYTTQALVHDTSLSGSGTPSSPLSVKVQHDGTLSGSGTLADPLRVISGTIRYQTGTAVVSYPTHSGGSGFTPVYPFPVAFTSVPIIKVYYEGNPWVEIVTLNAYNSNGAYEGTRIGVLPTGFYLQTANIGNPALAVGSTIRWVAMGI